MSKPKINNNKCVNCEECIYVCPYNAIRISKKTGKPFIISKYCRECGACVKACPVRAIKMK